MSFKNLGKVFLKTTSRNCSNTCLRQFTLCYRTKMVTSHTDVQVVRVAFLYLHLHVSVNYLAFVLQKHKEMRAAQHFCTILYLDKKYLSLCRNPELVTHLSLLMAFHLKMM